MSVPPTERSAQTGVRKVSLRYQLLAILVLAVAIYVLLESATDEEVLDISRLLELSAQDYDYFMADVDSIHYTTDGRADYRFRANRVTHYPNPEYSVFESPRFIIYREDDSAWRIESASGRVELDLERNQERLILTENVIINGITADGRSITITTDSMTLYPEARSMSTDRDVMLESDGFTSSSRGLFADLNTNVIRQLANGQMHYEQTGQRQ